MFRWGADVKTAVKYWNSISFRAVDRCKALPGQWVDVQPGMTGEGVQAAWPSSGQTSGKLAMDDYRKVKGDLDAAGLKSPKTSSVSGWTSYSPSPARRSGLKARRLRRLLSGPSP